MNSPSTTLPIGIGLILLVASTWWPVTPVLTAVVFVSVGATRAAVGHFHKSPLFPQLIAANLLVYGALYCLFIGAVWHASTFGVQQGWRLYQSLDLAASITLIVVVAIRCVRIFLDNHRGEDATSP
jgi:hypothetical protein